MSTAIAEARNAEVQDIRAHLERMAPQFQTVLKAFKIEPDRFLRVVMTAIQTNPDLAKPDLRRSLLSSCMRLATDGYMPDGVRAALVPYKGTVTPIKMIRGLREKVRESGEVSDWTCEVVYAGDAFHYQLGDEPRIHHVPTLDESKRGEIIAAYSVVTFKDGSKSRDVMSRADIDKREAVAKTSGIWNAWRAEMSAKTVGRHHAKELPTSNTIETFFREHDDELEAPDTRPAIARPAHLAIAGIPKGTDVPASDAAVDQGSTDTEPLSGEAAGGGADFAASVTHHARALATAAEDGALALGNAWARTPAAFKEALADTFEDLRRKLEGDDNGKV